MTESVFYIIASALTAFLGELLRPVWQRRPGRVLAFKTVRVKTNGAIVSKSYRKWVWSKKR